MESVHLAGVKCAGEGFDICRASVPPLAWSWLRDVRRMREASSVRAGVEAGVGFISWNFQASSCQPVSRALSWGGDWCSVEYEIQASTLFSVTLFLPLKVLGRKNCGARGPIAFLFDV